MKKLIEDMRNASSQAVGGTAFLDRHTLELAANQIEQLQSRLESLEKDAARWKIFVLRVSANIDFALSVCEERGADSLAIEELREAKSSIDTATQQTKD